MPKVRCYSVPLESQHSFQDKKGSQGERVTVFPLLLKDNESGSHLRTPGHFDNPWVDTLVQN